VPFNSNQPIKTSGQKSATSPIYYGDLELFCDFANFGRFDYSHLHQNGCLSTSDQNWDIAL